jgi:hypothetical protein
MTSLSTTMAALDACIATFRRHMQPEIAVRLAASHFRIKKMFA